MYAVISVKNQQFRVEPGTVLDMDRLAGEPGETVTFADSVMLAKDESGLKTGTPVLPGSSVDIEILEHFRGKKIVVFKMKRRKHYRRKQGHRQELTRVRIKDINVG